MKLEKFDYEIGNKKTKKEFIILGFLCIALIVTVALYKTFASFTSAASYNIISARVANFGNRTAVTSLNISKTNQDNVIATLYDDNTLSIDGTGYMKDFTEVDLIGELLDKYITEKVTFTEEELAFIADHTTFMNTMFDYAGRSFMNRDSSNLTQIISDSFVDNENNPIQADIDMVNTLMTKISNSEFDIDQIEIIGSVKNIGANAFSLINATSSSSIRDNIYSNISSSLNYKCVSNTALSFDMFTIEAPLEDIGNNALVDINARNISIGTGVAEIPDDLFAWYNGQNDISCTNNSYSQNESKADVTLTIPSSVTKIGIDAFYSYNGSNLTLPNGLEEIDERAFANYYGNDITIPDTVTTIKQGAFRDFTGKITMSSCPANKDFAPNADIYANNTLCEFN